MVSHYKLPLVRCGLSLEVVFGQAWPLIGCGMLSGLVLEVDSGHVCSLIRVVVNHLRGPLVRCGLSSEVKVWSLIRGCLWLGLVSHRRWPLIRSGLSSEVVLRASLTVDIFVFHDKVMLY